MNEILAGLKERQSGLKNVDSLIKDGESGALFITFAESENKKAEVGVIMETAAHERTPEQKSELNELVTKFSNRLRAAEDLIVVMNSSKLPGLQTLLENSIPQLNPGELPLYIKGLSVRSPGAFRSLQTRLTKIEASIGNKSSMKQVESIKTQLDQLAASHDIDSARLGALIREPLAALREEQINAALGGAQKQGFLRRDVGKNINKLITSYREALDSAGKVAAQFGGELLSQDTTDDFFADIPKIIRAKREKLPEGELPISADLAQKMTNPDGLATAMEETVRREYGGEASVQALRSILKANKGKSALELGDLKLTVNGTDHTLDEVFDRTSQNVRNQAESRGYLSSLIALIFGSFFEPNVLKARQADTLTLASQKA